MKRFATSVLVGLAALGGAAQTAPARPRLVVGIVVDQLRTDYIEYLQEYFGEKGFKTLLRDGAYLRDVDFHGSVADPATATAVLFTGAWPSETGVPAALVYEEASSRMLPPLARGGASLTNDSFTPEGLRLSTVADELAVDASGLGQIYSVALDPQQAVVMAGHAGNGAVWVNNTSGNWATTSYYGTLPSAVSSRNFRQSLSQRLDTMKWTPSARLAQVPWLSQRRKANPFRYTFSRQDRDVYKKFAASALSNTEVTDVAIDLIRGLSLGSNPQETDMLNIGYTVAPFKYASDGAGRAELADAYLRLDGQLARLFDAIDRSVGRGNALIWLSSTGYCDEAVLEDKRYRIPGGEFSVKRARSLLNSYLSARHGSASYVGAIRDGQVYFDRKTLENLRVPAEEVIDDARLFLMKMNGVADAYTLSDILSASSPEEEALRLSADPKASGDIFVRYAPGWNVVDDEQTPPVSKPVRASAVMTPAFIMGPGIAPQVIGSAVEATAIAPTVTGSMRIRAPNGSRSRSVL